MPKVHPIMHQASENKFTSNQSFDTPLASGKFKKQQSSQHVPLEDIIPHEQRVGTKRSNVSIRTCLIILIAFLEILTVLTLSSVWISCFLPPMLKWGSSVREKGFDNIVQFTHSTLKELILVVETQREILSDGFDPYDTLLVEKHMFKLFKNELIRHPSLPLTLFLGDHTRYNYGVFQLNETMLVAFQEDSYYYCYDYANNDYCVRNFSAPFDVVLEPIDMTPIWDMASSAPNGTRFTESYADITFPSITFITLLTMVKNSTNPSDYYFWIGYDVSVESFSKYLTVATRDINGAIAFTIEVNTNYLISNYNPDVSVASWDENQVETRYTALTVLDNGTNLIGSSIYKRYPNLNEISGNEKVLLEVDGYYISLYRLSTEENIDWLIVFAEPTSNYLESIFVAVSAALVSSLGIIIISILFGVYVSFKIIQPFYDLIFNFSEVSDMKLEGLSFQKSLFREVQILQGHFKGMVEKIKLYRCFIPIHLISKIDGGEDVEKSRRSKESTSRRKSGLSYEKNSKEEASESFSSISSLKKQQPLQMDVMTRFSLHLDKRKVAFTSLYIEGMNDSISNCSFADTVNILSDIFKYIYDLSKIHSGSVGNFDNETITITFNSNIDASSPEKKATTFASAMVKKLNGLVNLKKSIRESSEKDIGFRAAVLSQFCCCGNLGTNEFKNFTIVGSFQKNLLSMLELALHLNVELVVSEEIKTKTQNFYQHRYIDSVVFLTDDHYGFPELDKSLNKNWGFLQASEYGQKPISMETRLNSNRKQTTEVNVYEYGEFLQVKEDEWMYELEEKNKRNQWQPYHAACTLFWDKKYEEACGVLNEFLDRSIQNGKIDLPTINLLEKIKKQQATLEQL